MATQAEQRWIQQNQDLTQQMFGTLNPPDGQVGQFVKQWYDQNGSPAPDATDAPILAELSTQQSIQNFNNQSPTNQGGGQVSTQSGQTPVAAVGGGENAQTGGTANVNPITNITYAPVQPSQGGGNYNQTQNASQGGQFQTLGQQNTNQVQSQEQNQTGFQNTTQQQTGSQSQTGQSSEVADTTQSTTGQTRTTGTNKTSVDDTLGFGKLLQGQVGQTQANDAVRNNFLSDLVGTGGQAFNSQVDQAVRNSLTGPSMTGAGESARARASGYAAAQIARQNTDQRLAAANQLAGPSALTSLVNAGNPYLGKTENIDQTANSTGTMTGRTATMGNTSSSSQSNLASNTATQSGQDTNSLSKLVGSTNELNTGATNGQSSQNAFGQIPQGQPVKTGGCVLCTAAIHLGLSKHHLVLRRVISHKLNKDWSSFRYAARGYFFLFTPLARWLLTHPRIAATLWPMAKAVVYEELRVSGLRLPRRRWATAVHWIGHYLCSLIGRLPVPGEVTDPVIKQIARDNNILFEVQS